MLTPEQIEQIRKAADSLSAAQDKIERAEDRGEELWLDIGALHHYLKLTEPKQMLALIAAYEQQASEIERLQRARIGDAEIIGRWQCGYDGLTAERDRLREALDIAHEALLRSCGMDETVAAARMKDARAALPPIDREEAERG